ncbi:MAG: tetraacyldisaccharide 4'-kinase [Burkholderiaceae bacterium]|nr:tetraacyldisaccharide 4'-kinase [Burkholderiaceae bacterium]
MALWLQRHWWTVPPTLAARALAPLSWVYRVLEALQRRDAQRRRWRARCPVLVVGNLVAGGAGKTPTVIALVQALRAAGWHPGVVSRGYGRATRGLHEVDAATPAATVGDEPWLIHRRTLAPVVVAERRTLAARELLRRHPEVDLLIADDGLQHHALARDAEVWVFDERGVGNGMLLPAGPLRQPLPQSLPPQAVVLYNAPRPSTPLRGALARRTLAGAALLADWQRGAAMDMAALKALAGRPIPALAGIGAPDRFFDMLRDAGLTIEPLPLPDHARLDAAPWRAGTPEVVCTEKDAAKLVALGAGTTRVWVVGLDFRLPQGLVAAVQRRLRIARRRRAHLDGEPGAAPVAAPADPDSPRTGRPASPPRRSAPR